MAANLRAGDCLALPWVIGWAALVWQPMQSDGWAHGVLWWLVLLCSLMGAYGVFRVRLDAWLFKWLGQERLSMTDMDIALSRVFGRIPVQTRSMADRVQGARRWLLRLVILIAVQWLLIGLLIRL